jgi:hypothetical protein
VLLKIWWEEGNIRKVKKTNCFVLNHNMQDDLFIPESWTEVTTWVEEIQLVAMEITRGKPSRVWCTIERVKQHHEDHKDESFCLTPSLLLDITCNPKHELELDLWKSKKICKKKLQARKEKKITRVKPYEKM